MEKLKSFLHKFSKSPISCGQNYGTQPVVQSNHSIDYNQVRTQVVPKCIYRNDLLNSNGQVKQEYSKLIKFWNKVKLFEYQNSNAQTYYLIENNKHIVNFVNPTDIRFDNNTVSRGYTITVYGKRKDNNVIQKIPSVFYQFDYKNGFLFFKHNHTPKLNYSEIYLQAFTYVGTSVKDSFDMAYRRDCEIISGFCNYLAGQGYVSDYVSGIISAMPSISQETNYFQPKTNGYAYLDIDKKLAPQLIPDITISQVNGADISQIFFKLTDIQDDFLSHDKPLYQMLQKDSTSISSVLSGVKLCLQQYIIRATKQHQLKNYDKGDILVVSFFNYDKISSAIETNYPKTINVFSKNFMCGGWMCSYAQKQKDETGTYINTKVNFLKISFNQGQIVSVNKIIPNENGDVTLKLSDIYSNRNQNYKIAINDAKAIQMVKNTSTDPNAILSVHTEGTLIPSTHITDRLVYNNKINQNYAYTTLNQHMDLSIASKKVYDNLLLLSSNLLKDGNLLNIKTLQFNQNTVENISSYLNTLNMDISAQSYIIKHQTQWSQISSLYDGNIYDYFGITPYNNDQNLNISQVIISNIPGRIIDIYYKNINEFIKIDLQTKYDKENDKSTILFLSQYNKINEQPKNSLIDGFIIRYTTQLKDFNLNPI